MQKAEVVQIETPNKYVLHGLWFGPQKAKRVIVWVHGLGGSMFSRVGQESAQRLADSKTAFFVFNNRGHGLVNNTHSAKKSGKPLRAGSAHEIFTDCVDDITGAVRFAKKRGAKDVFLGGHSTGCQKAIYYAYKTGPKAGIAGIILAAPVSDYGAALITEGTAKLARAAEFARKAVKAGKKHAFMPAKLLTKWSVNDAQRFLSLYTPDSIETIFPYEQPKNPARTLRSIKKPILVLWAQKDQYADDAKEIVKWFDANIRSKKRIVIVPKVMHGFKGGEKIVANAIRSWMKSI